MSSIDKRIVQMDFDNAKFERKAQTTLQTLDSLKKGMEFKDSTSGIDGIGAKLGNINLSPLATAAETVNKRFSTMGTFTSRIIENIADSAYRAGSKIASYIASPISNAVSKIKVGGWNRAANLEQAKFTMEGLGKSWDDYGSAIQESVNDTSYTLDQAAMLGSKLLSSGIEDSTELQDILTATAGTAAVFGANYDQVGDIFQDCISKGVAMGDEFSRLEAIGVPAAQLLADEWGVTAAEIKDMASKRQVSGLALIGTLLKNFGDQAAKSNETYSGALANMGAALSRIGENLATPLREHLRDIYNGIRGIINGINVALEPVYNVLKDKMAVIAEKIIGILGGTDAKELKQIWGEKLAISFQNIADSISNLWDAVGSVITPIREALHEVFPPATIWQLNAGTKSFADFTAKLKVSESTSKGIKSVFTALFTVIKRVINLVKTIWKVTKPVRTILSNIISEIGKFVSKIADAVTYGDNVWSIFAAIKDNLFGIGKGAKDSANGLFEFLDKFPAFKAAKEHFAWMKDKVTDLGEKAFPMLKEAAKIAGDALTKVFTVIKDILKATLGDSFTTLCNDIKSAFSLVVKHIKGEATGKLDLVGIFTKIGKDILDIMVNIVSSVGKLLSGIWKFLTNLPIDVKAIASTAATIASGILSGIGTAISMVSFDFTPLIDGLKKNPIVKGVSDFFDSMTNGILSNTRKANAQNKQTAEAGIAMRNTAGQLEEDTSVSFGIISKILTFIDVAKDSIMTTLLAASTRAIWYVGSIFKNSSTVVEEVSKVFKSVAKQNRAVARSTNANAFLKLAAAIGVFALSIIALSFVPTDKLFTIGAGLIVFVGVLTLCLATLNKIGKVSGVFSGFILSIKNAIRKVATLAGFGLMIGGIGAGVYLIVQSMIAIANMDWKTAVFGALGVAGILAGLVTAAKLISKYAGKISKGTAVSLLAIAGSVYILTFAVKRLGKIKLGNWIKGLIGVAVVLGSLAGTAILLKKFGGDGKSFNTMGKSILKIAAGLFIISIAVKSLGNMKFGEWLQGLAGLVVIVGGLTAAAILLNKQKTNAATELGQLAIGIGAIAAALWVLGTAIASVNNKFGGDTSMLVKIGIGVLAFVAVMALIARYGLKGIGLEIIEFSASLLIIAAALWVMSDAVVKASSLSWDQFAVGVATLAVAIAALVVVGVLLIAAAPALGAVGTTILPFAGSLFLIAAAVWLVVDALDTLLSSPSFAGLREKFGELAGWMIDRALEIKEVWDWVFGREGAENKAQKDAANESTISSWAAVKKKVNQGLIDENDAMYKQLTADAETAAKQLGYDSLEGYLVGMKVKYPELYSYSKEAMEYGLDGARDALDSHSPSKAWMSLAFDSISGYVLGTEQGAGLINAAVSSLFSGMGSDVSDASNMEEAGTAMINDLITSYLNGESDISSVADSLADTATKKFGESIDFTNMAKTDFNDMLSYLAGSSDELSSITNLLGSEAALSELQGYFSQKVGQTMVENTATAISNSASSMEGVIGELKKVSEDAFEAGGVWQTTLGEDSVDYIGDGLIEGAYGEGYASAFGTLADTATTALDSYSGDFAASGENSAVSFANGANAKLLVVRQTFEMLAQNALDALNHKLGIASPSKEFTASGENSGIGFANGIAACAAIVNVAANGLATTALDSVESALYSIPEALSNVDNLNPVITPIMDLSNIQNGVNSIPGMFADTTLGVSGFTGDFLNGSLSNLSTIADAFNANRGTGNEDVVNAIVDLNREIYDMGVKMSNLQVRMDSGALVGSIANKMDSSLGGIARRRGRVM